MVVAIRNRIRRKKDTLKEKKKNIKFVTNMQRRDKRVIFFFYLTILNLLYNFSLLTQLLIFIYFFVLIFAKL